jgi:hypothetical protein
MKKILVTTLAVCAIAASALAQGTVTISASSGKIQYMDAGVQKAFPKGNPATVSPYGQLNIGIYAAVPGTTLSMSGGVPVFDSKWFLAAPIVSTIAPVAGGVPGTTVTIPTGLGIAAGNPVQLEIVGWTGTATDFPSAFAAGGNVLLGWAGDTKSGGMFTWLNDTGTAQTAATLTAGAFNGLVLAPIPEPSTFALAGLGAAALLIFRRRK